MQMRRSFRRPGIRFVIRRNDLLGVPSQELAKRGDVQVVMLRSEARQVFLRQLEQSHRRPQTPAVLGMSRMFEIFLQMNKRAGGLDQAFKEIIVRGIGVQPKLLKNVVRFVIELFVPAAKEGAIKWVLRNVRR